MRKLEEIQEELNQLDLRTTADKEYPQAKVVKLGDLVGELASHVSVLEYSVYSSKLRESNELCLIENLTYKATRHDATERKVYENADREMYVSFGDFICPVMKDGEIAKFFVNQFKHRFRQDDFWANDVSLGEKVSLNDYKLVDMPLDDFLIIRNHPNIAIAEMNLRLSKIDKELDRIGKAQANLEHRIDQNVKLAHETRQDMNRLKRYIGDTWQAYTAILQTLQGVFRERKKWRARFQAVTSHFFNPVNESVWDKDDEDIPF